MKRKKKQKKKRVEIYFWSDKFDIGTSASTHACMLWDM
jgi:hypothetical protein